MLGTQPDENPLVSCLAAAGFIKERGEKLPHCAAAPHPTEPACAGLRRDPGSCPEGSLLSRFACSLRAASLRRGTQTGPLRDPWFLSLAAVHPRGLRRLSASYLSRRQATPGSSPQAPYPSLPRGGKACSLCCGSSSQSKRFAGLLWDPGSCPEGSPYLSRRQATPGSSLPSMNSREAPPPVEMWVILSA